MRGLGPICEVHTCACTIDSMLSVAYGAMQSGVLMGQQELRDQAPMMLVGISQGSSSRFMAATRDNFPKCSAKALKNMHGTSERTPLKHGSKHAMIPGHVRQASAWEAWSTAATSAGGTGRTARAVGTGGRMSGIAIGGWTMTGRALLPAASRP